MHVYDYSKVASRKTKDVDADIRAQLMWHLQVLLGSFMFLAWLLTSVVKTTVATST